MAVGIDGKREDAHRGAATGGIKMASVRAQAQRHGAAGLFKTGQHDTFDQLKTLFGVAHQTDSAGAATADVGKKGVR